MRKPHTIQRAMLITQELVKVYLLCFGFSGLTHWVDQLYWDINIFLFLFF